MKFVRVAHTAARDVRAELGAEGAIASHAM
jgi:hypothetical protein